MDVTQATKYYQSLIHSHGCLLFSIEQEKSALRQRKDNAIAVEMTKVNTKLQRYCSQSQNRFRAYSETLKGIVDAIPNSNRDMSILCAAEYVPIGTAKLKGLEQYSTIPYIVPFLGKNSIAVEGTGLATDIMLKSIMISALEQTAAGQLSVSIYNPEWRDTFSCFAILDDFESISSQDGLSKLFDRLSEQISAADSVLKGQFPSILALRQEAKQPVGQLRLVVITGDDWLQEPPLRSKLVHLLAGAPRAGIGFILQLPAGAAEQLNLDVKKIVLLKESCSGEWKTTLMPNVLVRPYSRKQNDILDIFNALNEKAKQSVAIAIPFDSIENTHEMWRASSAEGITFSLGKAGMETVTLRMGDENTQINNALITGAPGKGKSNLLEVIIHSLCCRYSPNELELYLLDFKDGLTFKPYGDMKNHSWIPHAAVLGIESERDFGVAVLEHIEEERLRRARAMKKVDAHTVAEYRTAKPASYMPRIVIVIDEYQKLVEFTDDTGIRAAELIENTVRQGRACGIHLILASQTVERKGALAAKSDAIYASIPIRIALQNNIQESYATFVQGNDAAARLRVRGEAVMNINYGALDSNMHFTVAYADPKQMQLLRKQWCTEPIGRTRTPKVFGTNDFFSLPDALEMFALWRGAIEKSGVAPKLLCGQALTVDRAIVGIPFGKESGRNVAIFGNGDGEETDTLPLNYAVGILQGMALSLAIQHPEGDAVFTLIDGMLDSTKKRNGFFSWMSLMERLGFPMTIVPAQKAPEFFSETVNGIKRTDCPRDSHYIIGMGMDRCTNMADEYTSSEEGSSKDDAFGGFGLNMSMFNKTTGSEQLGKLLEIGPPNGVHFIGWWNNYNTFESQVRITDRGYIETKLLLHTGVSTARSILNTAITNWEGEANRLLAHDDTAFSHDMRLMPMSPLRIIDVGKMEAKMW